MIQYATSLPEGYHSVTASLTVKHTDRALDFYRSAFDAQELDRVMAPDGTVIHSEFRIGDTRLMISDEVPEWDQLSPESLGGNPVVLHLYVADADSAYRQAVDAGAEPIRPVLTQFWGDRSGTVRDPFGYRWTIAQRVEVMSNEEVHRRADAWMANPLGTEV